MLVRDPRLLSRLTATVAAGISRTGRWRQGGPEKKQKQTKGVDAWRYGRERG